MADAPELIEQYYKAFNERHFVEAAEMFSVDAEILHRPGSVLKGPKGYMESARMATTSFSDLHLDVLNVKRRGDTIVEVELLATGTHAADWTASGLGTVKATGRLKRFHLRETLEIRAGKFTFSSLNYNLQELADSSL